MPKYDELKQLLVDAKTKGANERRSEAFEFAIDAMVQEFEYKFQQQNDETEVSTKDKEWIEQFLNKCWETVQNTDLVYTQDSRNSASRLCIGLADWLYNNQAQDPNLQKNKFQYLIPSLIKDPHGQFCKMLPNKTLKKDINKYAITDFVLDDSNTKLIHVEEVIEQSVDAVLRKKRWKARGDCYLTIRGEYNFQTNAQELSSSEKKRICEHTKETGEYCIKLERVSIFNIRDLLSTICNNLGKASANTEKGGDLSYDINPDINLIRNARIYIWLYRLIVDLKIQKGLDGIKYNHLSLPDYSGLVDLFDRALNENKTLNKTKNDNTRSRLQCADYISDDMATYISQNETHLLLNSRLFVDNKDATYIQYDELAKKKETTVTEEKDLTECKLNELKKNVAYFAAKEFRESLKTIESNGKYSTWYMEKFVKNNDLMNKVVDKFAKSRIDSFFSRYRDSHTNNHNATTYDKIYDKICEFIAIKYNVTYLLICITEKAQDNQCELIKKLITNNKLSKEQLIDLIAAQNKNFIDVDLVSDLFGQCNDQLNLSDNLQTLIGQLAKNPDALPYAVKILKQLYENKKLKKESFTDVIKSLVNKEEAKKLFSNFLLQVTKKEHPSNNSDGENTETFDYFCNLFGALLLKETFTINENFIDADLVFGLFDKCNEQLNLSDNLQTLIEQLAKNPDNLQYTVEYVEYAVEIFKKLYEDKKLKKESFTGVIKSLVNNEKKEEAKKLFSNFLLQVTKKEHPSNNSGGENTETFDYFCNSFDALLLEETFTISDVADFTKVVRDKNPNIGDGFVEHLFIKFLANWHETIKIQLMLSVFYSKELISNLSALFNTLNRNCNVNKKSLFQCFLKNPNIQNNDKAACFLKLIKSDVLGTYTKVNGRLKKSTKNWRIFWWTIAILAIAAFALIFVGVCATAFTFFALSFFSIVVPAMSVYTWVCLSVGATALLIPFVLLLSAIILGPIAIVKSKVDGKAHVKLYTVNDEGTVVELSRDVNANKLYYNSTKNRFQFQNDDQPINLIRERSFGANNDALVQTNKTQGIKAFLFDDKAGVWEIRNSAKNILNSFINKDVVLIDEIKILEKIDKLRL